MVDGVEEIFFFCIVLIFEILYCLGLMFVIFVLVMSFMIVFEVIIGLFGGRILILCLYIVLL